MDHFCHFRITSLARLLAFALVDVPIAVVFRIAEATGHQGKQEHQKNRQ
jgi:hypothetical protein